MTKARREAIEEIERMLKNRQDSLRWDIVRQRQVVKQEVSKLTTMKRMVPELARVIRTVREGLGIEILLPEVK